MITKTQGRPADLVRPFGSYNAPSKGETLVDITALMMMMMMMMVVMIMMIMRRQMMMMRRRMLIVLVLCNDDLAMTGDV